jgi:hypothetical protein
VGCLGYPDDRRPGYTPVYALDLQGYRISEFKTSGDRPGWLFKHEAKWDPEGNITIRGGTIIEESKGEHRYWRNVEDFALNIQSGVWHRLTNRNWHQFLIHREDWGDILLEHCPDLETLLPRIIELAAEPRRHWNQAQIVVGGVNVSLTVDVQEIRIVVEGHLSGESAVRFAEEVRGRTEATVQHRCVLEQR